MGMAILLVGSGVTYRIDLILDESCTFVQTSVTASQHSLKH